MRSKVTGSRSKVTQRSDPDVAQKDPLRNIPAKFELPAANCCRDIARTRSMDRWTDRQTDKMVTTIPLWPSWPRGKKVIGPSFTKEY